MSTARPLPDVDQDVYLVAQWKYELDSRCTRWQCWWFKYIFLPIVRFSFRRVGIPPVTEVTAEGGKITCSWYEIEGVFADADEADLACLGRYWSYKRFPFGRLLPPESAQYGTTIFPRAKNPRNRHQPQRLALVVKDRIKEEQEQRTLADYLAQLNRVLDQ